MTWLVREEMGGWWCEGRKGRRQDGARARWGCSWSAARCPLTFSTSHHTRLAPRPRTPPHHGGLAQATPEIAGPPVPLPPFQIVGATTRARSTLDEDVGWDGLVSRMRLATREGEVQTMARNLCDLGMAVKAGSVKSACLPPFISRSSPPASPCLR